MKKQTNYTALIFLTLLILINANYVSGQNAGPFKVKFDPPVKYEKNRIEIGGIIGNIKDGYVQCFTFNSEGKSGVELIKFDENFGYIKTSSFPVEANHSEYLAEAVIKVGNKYYFIYSSRDRSTKAVDVFAREIIIKDGIFSETEITLIKGAAVFYDDIYKGAINLSGSRSAFYRRVSIVNSPDSNLVLFTYLKDNKDQEKADHEVIGTAVFDEDMKTIWNKEIELPYAKKYISFSYKSDIFLDKKGQVYFKLYADHSFEKKDEKTEKRWQSEILLISEKGNKTTIVNFNLNKISFYYVTLFENLKNEIMVTGYYSTNNKDYEGLIMAKLDNNAVTSGINPKLYPLPLETIITYLSKDDKEDVEKNIKKGNPVSVRNLRLRNIICTKDGSMLINGEIYTGYSGSNSTSTTSASSAKYNYWDIYVYKINANGELGWIKKIPKRQWASSHETLGYSVFEFNDNQYFFYMDRPENLVLNPEKELKECFTSKSKTLMYTKLDASGNQTKALVVDISDVKGKLAPTEFICLNNNVIAARIHNGKNEISILRIIKQ